MHLTRLARIAIMAASGIGAAGVAIAQTGPLPSQADLTAQADAILEAAYPADGPGAAVIIMRDGRTIYRSERGLADVETRKPITPDSVFRLGSLTKQFTAAAVLRMVDDGKLRLDDPVANYLPDYPQPGASATVRQLLNHTSGIPSYNDIPGWMVEANTSRPYTTPELVAVFRDLPQPTPPGQAWAYSNSGYVLLGAIMESVTLTPWHETVAGQIAQPLHLTSIGYGPTRESSAAMVEGYTSGPDGVARPARPTHMSLRHAAAGLVGTAGDLATWTQALHHGKVVTPILYDQMIAPTTLPEGRAAPYGFGLAFGDVRGRRAVRHDGRVAGFSNESIYIPSDDVTVVVLTNSDRPATPPSLLGRRLAALAVGEPYSAFSRADVDARTLAPLFGVYRQADSDVSRRFLSRAGKLYMARDGAPEREVFSAGDDRFFYPDSFTWFRIERRPDGASVMHLHQDDAAQAETSTRTGDIPSETSPSPSADRAPQP